MPSVSKSQQRLMQAAEHGATFPKAQAINASMTKAQMHDFAVGSMKDKPTRVRPARGTVRPRGTPNRFAQRYGSAKG